MKLGKGFTVIVNGEIFQSCNIGSISMAHGYFNMIAWHDGEDERVIKCRLKDVEFGDSGITSRCSKRIVRETAYRNYLGERRSDMEIITPLEEIKEAFIDALKTVKENQQCNVTLKIDGKDFASMVKKYNHTGGD